MSTWRPQQPQDVAATVVHLLEGPDGANHIDLTGSKELETGMVSSWTTDREGGFGEEEIAVLDRLLPRLALTAKARLTRDIAENVLDTYVGPEAGRRIMRGDIQLPIQDAGCHRGKSGNDVKTECCHE